MIFSMKGVAERKALTASIIGPMLRSRKDRTQITIYKRFAPGPDGNIHTSVSVDTASNRLSSSTSPFFPASTNLQNASKKTAKLDPLYNVREIIIPPPGEVLVCGDLKNAEAILVGAYAGDWPYVEKILSGADTHTEHAQHFYEAEHITPLQRDIAKTITYASFYYAKIPTLQQHLNREAEHTGLYFGQEEVLRLWKILMGLHPLEAWWAEVDAQLAQQDGILRNCFGYRRVFRDPDAHGRLKDALSFLPQSTVAWLMNRAMRAIYDRLRAYPFATLRLQIHDELMFSTPEANVPRLITTVTPLVEQRFQIRGRELYIPMEWKIGRAWGKMTAYPTGG